jgi:hypothetical protein
LLRLGRPSGGAERVERAEAASRQGCGLCVRLRWRIHPRRLVPHLTVAAVHLRTPLAMLGLLLRAPLPLLWLLLSAPLPSLWMLLRAPLRLLGLLLRLRAPLLLGLLLLTVRLLREERLRRRSRIRLVQPRVHGLLHAAAGARPAPPCRHGLLVSRPHLLV